MLGFRTSKKGRTPRVLQLKNYLLFLFLFTDKQHDLCKGQYTSQKALLGVCVVVETFVKTQFAGTVSRICADMTKLEVFSKQLRPHLSRPLCICMAMNTGRTKRLSRVFTSFTRFQTKRHFWLLRDRPFLCFSAIGKIYIQFSVNSPDLASVWQKARAKRSVSLACYKLGNARDICRLVSSLEIIFTQIQYYYINNPSGPLGTHSFFCVS